MNSIINNIKDVYKKKESYFITFVAAFVMGFLMFYYTHFEVILGNMGALYAYSQVFIQILLSILFGINIALLYTKLKFSASVNSKDTATVTIGSILSILVAGCPACGITLSAYLGLASVFASFPLFGLELKILGVLLLLYSTYSIARNMYVCKVKKK